MAQEKKEYIISQPDRMQDLQERAENTLKLQQRGCAKIGTQERARTTVCILTLSYLIYKAVMNLDCHITPQKHCSAQSTPKDIKISVVYKSWLIYQENTSRVGSRKVERTEFNQEERKGEKKNIYICVLYIEKNKRLFRGFGKQQIQEARICFSLRIW